MECVGSEFKNVSSNAINGHGLEISGSLVMKNLNVMGAVVLSGATIGRVWNCSGSYFNNASGLAINGTGLKVGGNAFMNKVKATGEVVLYGATIGGSLECVGSDFKNNNGRAVNGTDLKVRGSVFMNKFKATGEIGLSGATIGGVLDCTAADFKNESGYAIDGTSLNVRGSVSMNKFKATGEIGLSGAIIGGSLECVGSEFKNPKGYIINGENLEVGNIFYFKDSSKVDGKINLLGATISRFTWINIRKTTNLELDLRYANIDTILDDEPSWPNPNKGKLELQGLVYNEFDKRAPTDAKSRLKWIRLQYQDESKRVDNQFHPQPYEQLAKVFQNSGYEEAAKKVLIGKAKDQKKLTKFTRGRKIWYSFLSLIDYGYHPWKVWIPMALFLVFGSILFYLSYTNDMMSTTHEWAYIKDKGVNITRELKPNYPKFNPIMYSIDTFVPLINFHQQSYWLPDANRGKELFNFWIINLRTGGLIRIYLWIHIAFGWLLVSLLAAGLSGLVKS